MSESEPVEDVFEYDREKLLEDFSFDDIGDAAETISQVFEMMAGEGASAPVEFYTSFYKMHNGKLFLAHEEDTGEVSHAVGMRPVENHLEIRHFKKSTLNGEEVLEVVSIRTIIPSPEDFQDINTMMNKVGSTQHSSQPEEHDLDLGYIG